MIGCNNELGVEDDQVRQEWQKAIAALYLVWVVAARENELSSATFLDLRGQVKEYAFLSASSPAPMLMADFSEKKMPFRGRKTKGRLLPLI